jgi:hypothetical protein
MHPYALSDMEYLIHNYIYLFLGYQRKFYLKAFEIMRAQKLVNMH